MGIGDAVGGFSESVGAAVDIEVMKESIGNVTSGLGVAFDTTLLALVMSILIMFPSSSLQKAEDDYLAAVEDYCDEQLMRRLDDGTRGGRPEDRVIREAISQEMEAQHAELRGWLDRLGQIGETLTAHVVSGWEKIDEKQRVAQDQQLEELGQWTHARQREASEELADTQRGLLRDFRTSLAGMAVESRRIQEEGSHRLDEQLAGIERLHRRLQEEQQVAAVAHREQSQALSVAAEQLARTLARVRSEASEARDEGSRHLGEFAEGMREVARSAQEFQRGLAELEETREHALEASAERLAGTLARIDERLNALRELGATQLAAGRDELAELDRMRAVARRRDAEVRDEQIAALRETSEQLARTLGSLRSEAHAATEQLAGATGDLGPDLLRRFERLAEELAEPWRRQLAQLERIHQRLDRADAARPGGRTSRVRRFLSRS